jgi:hypothetical protein
MSLFHKTKPVSKFEPHKFLRRPNEISLAQWRTSPDLINAANRLWRDDTFQMMLEVTRLVSPANLPLSDTSTTDERAAHQAKIQGYNLFYAILHALTVPANLSEPLVETFEPEQP